MKQVDGDGNAQEEEHPSGWHSAYALSEGCVNNMNRIPDLLARTIRKKSAQLDELSLINHEKCFIPPTPELIITPSEEL